MSVESAEFTVRLEREAGFAFEVNFEGLDVPRLKVDELPPLGGGAGPNPARLLVTAVAHCLSASLLFCLSKFKEDPGPLSATVTGAVTRNDEGRLRVTGIRARLQLTKSAEDIRRLERCLGQFEDFCVVTQSVRQGIPVTVEVVDAAGKPVFSH